MARQETRSHVIVNTVIAKMIGCPASITAEDNDEEQVVLVNSDSLAFEHCMPCPYRFAVQNIISFPIL